MRSKKKNLDIVALGETMIRHFTRDHRRLEQCADLGFSIAGSESNLLVAASRLGLSCGWIGKLVENPLGRKIEREIAVHGVDLSRVIWTDKGRVGSFYIEFGSPPRPTQVTYDRTDSAASTLAPGEVDWDYVRSARWFHTTGITCALSKNCLDTVHQGLEEARRGGTKVSLDLNYRAKLWSPSKCKRILAPILPKVDLFISSAGDLTTVFGLKGETSDLAQTARSELGAPMALVAGSDGAAVVDKKGKVYTISFDEFPIKEVDRIGAGDAFAAGFFAGMLEKDLELGLLYGAATCALKFSIPGDLALVSREEILEVARGATNRLHR